METPASHSESIGVIFWNTWYRSEPGAQINHIKYLEDILENRGANDIILCLSEVSRRKDSDCLWNRLESTGYDAVYQPTGTVKGVEEGLCFASRTTPITDENVIHTFKELKEQQGFAGIKTRWLGHLVLDSLSIFTAHLSYPLPSQAEIEGIIQSLENDRWATSYKIPQLLGGDFNTLISHKIIKELEACGMYHLQPAKRHATVPIPLVGGIRRLGVNLDHALVSERITSKTTLQVGPKGPSNHRPLLVQVNC